MEGTGPPCVALHSIKTGKCEPCDSVDHVTVCACDSVCMCGSVCLPPQMLNILERFVASRGYSYQRMDGGTPISTRQPLINKFNEVGG